MSRIVAVALVLVGFQVTPGAAYQPRDCASAGATTPETAFETLRKLYVAGRPPSRSILQCAAAFERGTGLAGHIARHAIASLPVVDTLRAGKELTELQCKQTVRSLDCELRDLRKQQILGRLLTDLLAIPAAPETKPRPITMGRPTTRIKPVVVILPVMIRTAASGVDPPDPVRVATSVAAGPSVVAAGVRADFPAIMSVPLSAGLEYIDYMRRPGGLLLSAGMRRRPLAIMLGLSVGAGRPDPWVSLTADTSFGVHVGLLVGPAVGVRIGS